VSREDESRTDARAGTSTSSVARPPLNSFCGFTSAATSAATSATSALADASASGVPVALSGRGSWRVELDTGAALELGRGTEEEVGERTQRFVRTVPRVLHRFGAPLESADLRHAEGYAVKLKGVAISADVKSNTSQPKSREE